MMCRMNLSNTLALMQSSFFYTCTTDFGKGKVFPPNGEQLSSNHYSKGCKDPKLTVSYRPISLTSCVGKLLEKMVADRMLHILEDRNVLNDSQAGFRPGRCTTDQVLKLIQQASDQMHSTDNPRTMATFFDYEKAYVKVWRDGLLFKMQQLSIPDRYIR